MTEKERKQYIDYMTLRDELEEEKRQGYELSFAGREASADEIARACVFEETSTYMRDYGKSASGRSSVISFDPVRC